MTNNPIPLRDRQEWETMSTVPASSTVGSHVVASPLKHYQYAVYLRSATEVYTYDPYNDGWYQSTTSTNYTTFTAGGAASCWIYHTPYARSALLTAGYISEKISDAEFTINVRSDLVFTPVKAVERLPGTIISFTTGPNMGVQRRIKSATLYKSGAAIKLVLETPFPNTVTDADTITLYTGLIVTFINNGSPGGSTFVINSPINYSGPVGLSSTGLPPGMGTNCALVSTPSINGPYITGSVTSITSNSLTDSNAIFDVPFSDQYRQLQVRIISGSGEGRGYTITGHTGTTLTISGSWDVSPGIGSTYGIEPNDDYIWLMTSTASTYYRYSFYANTWTSHSADTTLGTGGGLVWRDRYIDIATTSSANTSNNPPMPGSLIIFPGNGDRTIRSIPLDTGSFGYFGSDIDPAGTTVGSSYVSDLSDKLVYYHRNTTGRVFEYPFYSTEANQAFQLDQYPESTAVNGNKMFIHYAKDRRGNYIKYLYRIHNTSNVVRRLRLS
jgi:hypothetical protein